jgi:hypothetical protein
MAAASVVLKAANQATTYMLDDTYFATPMAPRKYWCAAVGRSTITNYFHVLGLQTLAHYLNAAEHATTTHPVDDIF